MVRYEAREWSLEMKLTIPPILLYDCQVYAPSQVEKSLLTDTIGDPQQGSRALKKNKNNVSEAI